MRIAFLATGFPDYSLEASVALAQQSEFLLVADRDRLDLDSDAEKRAALAKAGQLATFRLRHPYRIHGCLSAWAAIARFKPDAVVIHQHSPYHVTWIHRRIAKLSKIFLIVHDPVPHTGRDKGWADKNAASIRVQRDLASAFLVHGSYCAGLLASHENVRGRPIIPVTHGPILHPKAGQPPAHRARVLMFGRMEAYKGLDVLLAAMRLLVAAGVKLELRLAGDGPELTRLAGDFLSLGCCSIRSGFIPRDAAIEEIQASGMVVAPYTEATQSGVVSAAFANGRPVIASAVGGLPDIVHQGQNGLLVPPNDPKALADAIRSVIESPDLLATLSAGALESAWAEMSWDRFATAVVSHLAESR